jgi:quinoprotein glucose dehydrogenase
VDALAQTTKQGYLYLLDRSTGQPLFPVEEMKVAMSTVPGEASSPTQPRPLLPAPYARQNLTEETLTERTPEAHAWALAAFRNLISGKGQFTPLSLDKQTVVMPGFDGGAEWGGPAVDPRTGILYVNSNDIAYTGGLVRTRATTDAGAAAYISQCAMCHGERRQGSPPQFPSLIDITDRLSESQIEDLVHQGRGRMPTFPNIKGETLDLLINYLRTGKEDPASANAIDKRELPPAATVGEPYHFTGYERFVDPDGYPAVAPPWGTLNAIDMNTGKYLWKIPFGEYPELIQQGMSPTGSENYGGPVVTAGGLLFIGATIFDRQFHVYNSSTGELLWHTELPYGGLATPATYMIDGKQYVVIAAGGGKDPKHEKGGIYVSFRLR